MLGGARAAFSRAFASPEFWADVREKGSLFVRVACLVHVVRTYGVEATAVRADLLHLCACNGAVILAGRNAACSTLSCILPQSRTCSRQAVETTRCPQPTETAPSQCVGPSMLPTFNARGDLLLQEWLSVYTERIKVGESDFACCEVSPLHVQHSHDGSPLQAFALQSLSRPHTASDQMLSMLQEM